MTNKKMGLTVMTAIVTVMLGSMAYAATKSDMYTNTTKTNYCYTTQCGSTTMCAIGANAYITQGINGTLTDKVVESIVYLSDESTGKSYYRSSAAVVSKSTISIAELDIKIGDGDTAIHEVTKYDTADAIDYDSAKQIDRLRTTVINSF